MTDGWILIPIKLYNKLELNWLEELYPDEVMRLPMGYFSRQTKGSVEEQVRLQVQMEKIKNGKI